jgi:hypothetical protein
MFMQRTFSISRSMAFPEVCISIFQKKKSTTMSQKVLYSYPTLNLHMLKSKHKHKTMGIGDRDDLQLDE